MKTVMLISDGVAQVALTPETDAERSACEMLLEMGPITVHHGYYYATCRGGWERPYSDETSILITARRPAAASDVDSEKPDYWGINNAVEVPVLPRET